MTPLGSSRLRRPLPWSLLPALAPLLLAACEQLVGQPRIIPPPPDPAPADAGNMTADAAPPADATPPDLWSGLPDVSSEAATGETAPPGPSRDVVYAHSGSDLFRVDPETMEVERVGNLSITSNGRTRYLNNVTDIAVDRTGRIVGLTFTQVLLIDPATGNCQELAPLPMGDRFNGLSWIRNEQGPEQLVATSLDGSVFRIDPATGAAVRIGALGGGLQSSGDLVSVASHGTLLTVKGPGGDQLARVDPATGAATVIGPTGFQKLWGLGFWKNRVFGFTQTGEFVLIDPRTGAGQLVRKFPAFPFWGAGVTTAVPVID